MLIKLFHPMCICLKILPMALLMLTANHADAGSYYGMGASSRAKIHTQTIKARTTGQGIKQDGLRSSHIPGGTTVNIQSKRKGGCGNLSVASVTGEDIKGDVTVISRGTVINVCK